LIATSEFSYSNCTNFSSNPERIDLQTKPGRSGIMIHGKPCEVGGADWRGARYLVFDILVKEEWAVGLQVGFWTESNHTEEQDLVFIIGVLPQVRARIAVPLAALDSQRMFFPRKPGQLKMVIHGNKVLLDQVNRIQIGVQKSSFSQTMEISNIHLTDVEPDYPLPAEKLVDELGQWNKKNWPGKMKSEAELVS
jgi:hypothetical protein